MIDQNIVEQHGFTYCGIIYLASGDERLAYQRNDIDKPRGKVRANRERGGM